MDAALGTDAKACEKHGITLRTLQNYRAALKTDPELSQLFDLARKQATQGEWADNLKATLNTGVLKLAALIEGVQKPTPGNIGVVTQAVLGLAEMAMTRDLLAARLRDAEQEPPPPEDDEVQPHALN